MSDQPMLPDGLEIKQTRVYYDPSSGDVVHVHQLVSAPGEELGAQRVEEEMKTFEEALRQERGDLNHLVVQADDLPTSGESITVDVDHAKLQTE